MTLIPLTVWAARTYGEHAPALATLRRWARDGRIQPAARKHGRTWFVEPGACYQPGDEPAPAPATLPAVHPAAQPDPARARRLAEIIRGRATA